MHRHLNDSKVAVQPIIHQCGALRTFLIVKTRIIAPLTAETAKIALLIHGLAIYKLNDFQLLMVNKKKRGSILGGFRAWEL